MNEELNFHAGRVSAQEADASYIVGLVEDSGAEEPDKYIILQRSIDEEAGEDDAEFNTYFLEICDAEFSGYGGIKSATLNRNSFEIALSEQNPYVNTLRKISIAFDLSSQEFNDLTKHLDLIFRDSDCALTIS